MTNTQQTFEQTAMLQDAFSLRKIQMLILWPLFVCLALAPLLFANSEYYGFSKTFFWLSAIIIAVLHIKTSPIIKSIEISSKHMPEIINKIDNEISKKYKKIMQIEESYTGYWMLLFAIFLVLCKWHTGAVATAYFNWDHGITPVVKDLIASIQVDFALLLFIGIMVYLFELKPGPYYWWTKKKRINNMVTVMLILLCVVASSRLDLVIGGRVPIEMYFQKMGFGFGFFDIFAIFVIISLLTSKDLPFAQMSYYTKLTGLIATGKKKIYVYTFYVSALSLLLALYFYYYFDHVLLAIGFGILHVTLIVVWYYYVSNNESKLVEDCQSDLQIEYEEVFKKHKLFQNRKLVLIYISIARYVDNNFFLLLFSSLLHGIMLLALNFL